MQCEWGVCGGNIVQKRKGRIRRRGERGERKSKRHASGQNWARREKDGERGRGQEGQKDAHTGEEARARGSAKQRPPPICGLKNTPRGITPVGAATLVALTKGTCWRQLHPPCTHCTRPLETAANASAPAAYTTTALRPRWACRSTSWGARATSAAAARRRRWGRAAPRRRRCRQTDRELHNDGVIDRVMMA